MLRPDEEVLSFFLPLLPKLLRQHMLFVSSALPAIASISAE